MKKEVEIKEGLRSFPAFPTVLLSVNDNLITLAMVHVFSFSPPLIGIGIAPSRYSYNLLKKNKAFVVNIPTQKILEAVIFCGEHSGRDYDKFKMTGLSKVKSSKIDAPLIDECPVNIECKIVDQFKTGDHVWFIGEVLAIHQEEGYNKEESIIYWGGEYRVIGRIIGRRY